MDKNGNTTQKGSWHYTYDYKNKIITASNGSKTISFEYDPFGRRITKSNGNQTTHYYYAGDQVIEERDGSDKLLKQYIYGNLIDEVLRMDKYNSTGNTIENSFYYHTDSIGNITAITDKDGNIIERYKYNIYGSPTITDNTGNILNSSAIGNDYLFQSRRYDKELHLYYYRARTYDPEIGRFLQTDPIGYKDSMNLYQAMNMNGWGFVDPWGEEIYKIRVYLKSAIVKFYSDTGKVYEVPAAVGSKEHPTAKPRTIRYFEKWVVSPTNRKWGESAGKPWNEITNPDNPFGPYLMFLVDDKGKNAHNHIHGTSGEFYPLNILSNLIDENGSRHFTHGCVRVPNMIIYKIYKEGVKYHAPVYYIGR